MGQKLLCLLVCLRDQTHMCRGSTPPPVHAPSRAVCVPCPGSGPGFFEPVCTVYIHTSQKVTQGRQSMVLRTVLQRPVMILLSHLLFANLADRVELSVSS